MLRQTAYRLAWDTRCRNIDVRRVLARFNGMSILDVGCGEYGLAAFMPHANITGADILPPESVDERLNYRQGSIIELPFNDRSFDIVVSVDVLEHLPEDLRERAVCEIVRTARHAAVIAFPSGNAARKMDEGFQRDLIAAGQPLPDWLIEHLAQPYPATDNIIASIEQAALKTGRDTAISTSFSEHLSVAGSLRAWASRSKYAYIAANLLAGILAPMMPRPAAETSYRSIVLAEFSDA